MGLSLVPGAINTLAVGGPHDGEVYGQVAGAYDENYRLARIETQAGHWTLWVSWDIQGNPVDHLSARPHCAA